MQGSFYNLTLQWLVKHHYPPGPIHLTRTYTPTLPVYASVGNFKVKYMQQLRAKGLELFAAYGNTGTDVRAYRAAGIPPERCAWCFCALVLSIPLFHLWQHRHRRARLPRGRHPARMVRICFTDAHGPTSGHCLGAVCQTVAAIECLDSDEPVSHGNRASSQPGLFATGSFQNRVFLQPGLFRHRGRRGAGRSPSGRRPAAAAR